MLALGVANFHHFFMVGLVFIVYLETTCVFFVFVEALYTYFLLDAKLLTDARSWDGNYVVFLLIIIFFAYYMIFLLLLISAL